MWFVSISGNLWGKSVRIGSSRYHLVAEARRMRGFSIFSIQSNTFFQFKQIHVFNSTKYIFSIQTNAFFQFKQIHFVNLNKYICFNLNKYVCFNLKKYMSSIWTHTILQFEQIHFFNLNIYIFFSIWTNTNTNLFESDEADTICWQKLDGWAVFLLGYNCQYFPLFWKRVAKVIMYKYI